MEKEDMIELLNKVTEKKINNLKNREVPKDSYIVSRVTVSCPDIFNIPLKLIYNSGVELEEITKVLKPYFQSRGFELDEIAYDYYDEICEGEEVWYYEFTFKLPYKIAVEDEANFLNAYQSLDIFNSISSSCFYTIGVNYVDDPIEYFAILETQNTLTKHCFIEHGGE